MGDDGSDELRELFESSAREFEADDAARKAREAERNAAHDAGAGEGHAAQPDSSAPADTPGQASQESADVAIGNRVSRVVDLFLGSALGPLTIVVVCVLLMLLFLPQVINRGSAGGAAAPAGGEVAATGTQPPSGDVSVAPGVIPVGTYAGAFTGDIAEVSRIYQKDSYETGRTELANSVTLTIAEDGSVTGTYEWAGRQTGASQWCKYWRSQRVFGEFTGTADDTGAITGRASMASEYAHESVCSGKSKGIIKGSSPSDLTPYTATVTDGHLVGEITGIFTFEADLGAHA